MYSRWFFLVFIAVISGLSPEETKTLNEVYRGCLQTHPVALNILQDLHLGKVHEVPELRDYLTCIFIRMGWADKDGFFLLGPEESRKFFRDSVPADKRDAIIETCRGPKYTTVFLVYKCYVSGLEPRISKEAQTEKSWNFVLAPNPE